MTSAQQREREALKRLNFGLDLYFKPVGFEAKAVQWRTSALAAYKRAILRAEREKPIPCRACGSIRVNDAGDCGRCGAERARRERKK